ncbi:MAG: hypothetical protein AAAC47_07155 [Pararhizobium sp.]
MKSVVDKVFAMALIVGGVLTALPSSPLAQSMDLYIGPGGPDLEYRDQYRRDYEWRGGCSERQAIRRAYRLGMRDPAIASMGRRQIVVDGIGRRGEYTKLRLANREGCPRIG